MNSQNHQSAPFSPLEWNIPRKKIPSIAILATRLVPGGTTGWRPRIGTRSSQWWRMTSEAHLAQGGGFLMIFVGDETKSEKQNNQKKTHHQVVAKKWNGKFFGGNPKKSQPTCWFIWQIPGTCLSKTAKDKTTTHSKSGSTLGPKRATTFCS